jgi:DNA-binding Lrp family transcriptional regulator
MDDFDIKLLRALQDDGRLTNYDLAERVGLSASQCSRRRSALEDAGVIGGYRAALSEEALGLDVIVFVQVTLATHSPDNSKRFAKLIDGLEEVQGGLFADRRGRLSRQDCGAGPQGALAHSQ